MPKYDHPDVLDGGLLVIKNSATRMLLIKNYSFGDSYATVTGNAVASVTMAPTDYTLASSGNSRTLTVAAKSATATGAALAAGNGQDHHIAFTDGSARVLWVTDETGEAANAVNDTINFPSVVHTSNQPT